MYKKTVFVLILFFCLSACALVPSQPAPVDNAPPAGIVETGVPEIALQPMFFEEKNFYQAIEHSQGIEAQAKIRAVIVPHHLLAANFISDTLKSASWAKIDKVIIIGPNHDNVGSEAIGTALVNWQTVLGTLSSDPQLVNQLISDLDIKASSEVFIKEHSVGAQTTFVKYFFPQAVVMGIVLSSYVNHDQVNQLSAWLAQNIDESTLVVFSIDFSHYLDKITADKMDLITKELIEKRDIEKILQLTNDNVDSPGSLAVALLLAEQLNLNTNILQQGNSFDFLNTKVDQTTSYFAISFSE